MYRLNDEQQRVVSEATAVAAAHIGPDAARVDREAVFRTDRSPRWESLGCSA